jgi:hypothetical protein
MRRISISVLVVAALVFAGCGKADIAVVARPRLQVYLCFGVTRGRCESRFDAGKLVGLTLREARVVAAHHPVKCVPGGLLDYDSGRIDVECTNRTPTGIITRIVGRG